MFRIRIAAGLLALPLPVCLAQAARADAFEDIGLNTLRGSGLLMTDGGGVKVLQVESKDGGGYAPDTTDAAFAGKTFKVISGAFPPSVHATGVAGLFYGSGGVAPGISTISLMEANDFVGARILHTGVASLAPGKIAYSVVNNSWIGSFASDADNIDAVRRLDFAIARDGVVVVNGVDNGSASAYPKLLATSYNGIAVGTQIGPSVGSSHGPVTFDSAAPRALPDIIAPADNTSHATPIVSGSAALLISEAAARGFVSNPLAVKSILMASADRLPGWQRGAAGTADDERSPLDYVQGAGLLRVDRAFDVLLKGRQFPTRAVAKTGWDTRTLSDGAAGVGYDFKVSSSAPQFTAMLAWNREIAGANGGLFDSSPTLPNLKLILYRIDSAGRHRLARSDSAVDNIESVTMDNLGAGNYELRVFGDRSALYGLAWCTNFHPVDAGAGAATFALLSPAPSSIAADSGWSAGAPSFNDSPGSAASLLTIDNPSTSAAEGFTSSAIPEPSALALCMVGLAGLTQRRRKAELAST